MAPNEAMNRVCPTRTDGRVVLFAHKVSPTQCQEQQRASFHKCFTCVHNNVQRTDVGLPLVAKRSVTAKHQA
jgi:hypothetical protein